MTNVLREVLDEDLDAIEIGAAILGTGGGGNPYIGKLRCREELKKGRKIPVIPLSELPDDAFVVSFFVTHSCRTCVVNSRDMRRHTHRDTHEDVTRAATRSKRSRQA